MARQHTDETVFIDHLESCKKLIAKIARAYCNDPEERKDLVQDITLQLWKSFPKYDKTFAITTWTYRIAINTSISFLRRNTAMKKKHQTYAREAELMHVEDEAVNENLTRLYHFIERLKAIDKAIMVLSLEGCPNKEISEVMGLSVSNVSTRKLRIKEQLKQYFETQNSNAS